MRIVIIGLILALFTACGSEKKSDEQAFLEGLDTTKIEGPSISEGVIGDILQRIPSPLEISVLLKESGKKYNSSYLNSPDNISKYNSNYKKALNLGVYGTDLGYTNIYEQNQDGVKYMSSIKTLADGLNIGQFFDIETIGRLATNSKNLDSLLLITTQNFNSINHYLQSQNRSNLSVLFLTGGWVEALNILCEVAAANPSNKELQETIGEQKIILENIMLLLSFYKDSDQNMASLLTDMEELKKLYDKVNITYTYSESTFEIVDGVMVIKDNSSSTIQITQEDIASIKALTSSIRNKIIS
ncbi:hypothetical protein [Chryseolinea sp. H1M3-3]|uniref:hypothetical protein n=1 Tax=Chryseolinea sp. H1M3-3 TaxID=3034144 RepID=UPI0023EDB9EE|nr:hypothetical protein [Chryseolinea sp. H1M3-3]